MQTIRVKKKSGADGSLSIDIPMGQPDTEYRVVGTVKSVQGDVVIIEIEAVQESAPTGVVEWPPGYFDLAGSIDDETFVRPPQGDLPKPIEFG